ncbi:MAG: ribonuclease HII [Gammaproteobacteria bacterium]|nr:ribonuclease HII [Gammaproteobacteria bacterium]
MFFRDHCAGVDEVGRGPLAGAVVAAAVILDPFRATIGLRDSKALTHARRVRLDELIRRDALAWSMGRAEVEEIDRLNILEASMLAMQRAVAGLSIVPDHVWVDGNRTPIFDCPADYLVKGDTRLDAIKAASIIAKVARDREMERLGEQYPNYGLAQHKGYPTRDHLDALKKYGPCPVHRMSFAPCRPSESFEDAATE